MAVLRAKISRLFRKKTGFLGSKSSKTPTTPWTVGKAEKKRLGVK